MDSLYEGLSRLAPESLVSGIMAFALLPLTIDK